MVRTRWSWATAVALGSALLACGRLPAGGDAPSGALTLHELDRRVAAAWAAVQRYRTVETVERLAASGDWTPATPPAATDFVLPDRKYRRPVEPTDPPGVEFLIIQSTIYQRIDGVWSIVDLSQVEPGSPVARSLEQLRTAGLDGPPFRLPPDVDGRLVRDGEEVLDGRPCRWYAGTANGPAGPVQLRVALEATRDLPCKTIAEYQAPSGPARTIVRYFDYNGAIRIEPPAP